MAKIGITILSYNSVKNLPDCLGSLTKSVAGFKPGDVEILVWDNASVDGSAEWVQKNYPSVRVIESPVNLGFAAGNNRAFEALKPTDYFVLLNDDTIVEPNWLEELVKMAQSDPKIMVVQSLIKLWPEKELINSWGNSIHFLGFGYAGGYRVPVNEAGDKLKPGRVISYASGASMLVKTSLLKETFLFDNDFFMYHEDLDLGWRVRLLGYKSVLAPDSVIYHKYSFRKSVKKYYYMERNRFICLFRNYHLFSLVAIFPALLVMEAMSFGYSLSTGWWREKLRAYVYLIQPKTLVKLFKAAKVQENARKAKDKDVIDAFTGVIEFQEMANPLLIYGVNPVINFYWRLIKKIILW